MVQLGDYKADHLILLVGGNPLPNYVAARVLGKEGMAISLICSEGSQPIADRLKNLLDETFAFTATELVDESRASSIQGEVTRALRQSPDATTVGLHYTGGTKAMAVHAYRAVDAWTKLNHRSAVFSYLDARTHKIIFDEPADEVFVGDALVLDLADLLSLHGWKQQCDPRTNPILPRTARAIAAAYADHGKDADQPYKRWKHAELYPKCKGDNGDWKRDKDLRQIKLAWPDGALSSVADALRQETGQHDQAALDIEAARQTVNLSAPSDFCKWLDGIWLEHRVLDALMNLPDLRPNPGQALQGVKIKTDKGDFDLDVAAIFGYQLFGFTCGTAVGRGARSELKLKLFEGLLRTRQIGGDQARTALVCVHEDPDDLQREARQQIDPEGQIRVFGCKQLADLESELAHWIRIQRKQP